MLALTPLLAFAALLPRPEFAALDTTPASCAASPVSRGAVEAPVAFVAVARPTPRDSLLRATVCVRLPPAGVTRIGSYHGELHFDSSLVAAVRVQRPAPASGARGGSEGGGMRVENTTIPGQVNFAGASPSGFPAGALVSVVLRLRTPGARPAVRLRMLELNGTDGADLMRHLRTAAYP